MSIKPTRPVNPFKAILPFVWAISCAFAAPPPFRVERISVPPAHPSADSNIRPLYPIEAASWVWHPAAAEGQKAVLLFRNEFEVNAAHDIIIHVSADQRYELALDGVDFSFGPDRSDLAHWSFASYRIHLEAGKHVFEARVAWIGRHAPSAQISHRGGFILACEGNLAATLNTGGANWRVREVKGWSFSEHESCVGASQTMDGRLLFGPQAEWVKPGVLFGPLAPHQYGMMRAGWRLHPSRLPEQKLAIVQTGTLRALVSGGLPQNRTVSEADCQSAAGDMAWSAMLRGSGEVRVPPNTSVSALIDLQDYYTGYPELMLSGGAGSEVEVAWAESLYQAKPNGGRGEFKGHRDEVRGKFFSGVRSLFRNDGGDRREFRNWWWSAGRYALITIRTSETELVLHRFRLLETRYPLEDEGRFASSDRELDGIQPLLVRGILTSAHETYTDSPYYEQLMYVGDARLEMLTTYLMAADDRLPKRGIELFDWSRSTWEMVAEQYPSRDYQLSPTYSLIWVSMLRDFVFWRNDPEFVRARLPGMRAVLEQFRNLRGTSGLLEKLPGWPFVDWVDGWDTGNAPDGVRGISSINNLFFIQALRDAAEIEDSVGEPALAGRNRDLARAMSAEVVRRFWVAERGLLADDEAHRSFSEHAQCLALLNGVLDSGSAATCFESLIREKDLHRATVYFSFYLFEVFKQQGRGDLIVKRMDYWKELVKNGFKTPPERPEPSRSDCHGWGCHPLYHLRASLCGIRPAAPGFGKVEIAPSPGPLSSLEARVPHPAGWITVKFAFAEGKCIGEVTLPPGIPGEFRWRDQTVALKPGEVTHIQ